MKNLPPTNDPSLPSYECPEYQAQSEVWATIGDTFRGRLNRVDNPERYLPQEANEPTDAYPARLIRSPFENHVKKIITSYAGTIGGLTWDGKLPIALKSIADDIDLKGSSIEVFVGNADVMALRDKYCFILIDYQKQEAENREQERQNPSQPFWRVIDPRQVINWHEDCGEIEQLTIAEVWQTKKAYGSVDEKVYRVINGDKWRLVRLVETTQVDTNGQKIWREEIVVKNEDGINVEQWGQYLQANGQSFGCCPVVPYSLSTTEWMDNELPAFIGVADLNIALYQSTSDWRSIVRSLCPVPWVRADDTARLLNSKGQLSIGPHDFLDLGSTGSNACGYLQSNPQAVDPAYQVVVDLRNSIEKFSIGIHSQGNHQITATQIRTMFMDVQETIDRYAKHKESTIDNLMLMTAKYLGIDASIIPKAMVASDISGLLADETTIALLYKDGLLSLESAVNRLNQLGFNENATAEILRLNAAPTPAQPQQGAISAPLLSGQTLPPTP